MKLLFGTLLLTAMFSAAAPATAQVPYLNVRFQVEVSPGNGQCRGVGVMDTLSVVANNLNM